MLTSCGYICEVVVHVEKRKSVKNKIKIYNIGCNKTP